MFREWFLETEAVALGGGDFCAVGHEWEAVGSLAERPYDNEPEFSAILHAEAEILKSIMKKDYE